MTDTLQGPTLADAKGLHRIRKLQASRDNLLAQIEEKQESIVIMDHEIAELQAAVGSDIGDKVQFMGKQLGRPASNDPTVSINITVRKRILDQMEDVRGDVSRSRWIDRAIEARLKVKS